MVLMPLLSRMLTLLVIFFFSSRRRHTISKRDWSSDVCSSDLDELDGDDEHDAGRPASEVPEHRWDRSPDGAADVVAGRIQPDREPAAVLRVMRDEIGRASGRGRVWRRAAKGGEVEMWCSG